MLAGCKSNEQRADTVFRNATVLTMDDAHPTAEAVAITDNTITYVEPFVLAGPLQHLDVGHNWQE